MVNARAPSPAEDDATGQAPGQAIDFGHLARQTMGDEALAHELLRLFLGQTSALVDAIEGDGPAKAREDAAHTLKGAAAAVGAFEVMRHALATEASIRLASSRRLRRHIAGLRSAVAASRAAIARFQQEEGLQEGRGDAADKNA